MMTILNLIDSMVVIVPRHGYRVTVTPLGDDAGDSSPNDDDAAHMLSTPHPF